MKQILIIDDDISINDMLDKVLARAGYETFSPCRRSDRITDRAPV